MSRRTATAALALGALLATAPPSTALRLLTASPSGDPTGALVGAVALTAWALVGWLLLAAAVTAAGHLPGVAGRVTAAIARRVAPQAVRRAVEVALGLAVTGAVLGTSPASASDPSQPVDTAARGVVSLDWGATPSATPSAPPAAPTPAAVVVAPGDSLWSLAEQHLAQQQAEPSDADVAASWPSWWAANRDAVGPDPHLIRPGTSLVPPVDRS